VNGMEWARVEMSYDFLIFRYDLLAAQQATNTNTHTLLVVVVIERKKKQTTRTKLMVT